MLLTTAAVKLIAPNTDTATSAYPAAVLLLGTQVELGLGVWLLLGRARFTAWIMAALLFTILFVLSVRAAIIGQSDCGCFGAFRVHPWFTALADLLVLNLLAYGRPRRLFSNAVGSFTAAGLLAVAIGTLAVLVNGPVGERWLSRWRGEELSLNPVIVDAGQEVADAKKTLLVTVRNLSDHDVKLIGGSVSCSCTTTKNLPLAVPAGGSVEVEINLIFKGSPGQFTHRFELLSDHRKQPKLNGMG